MVDQHMDYAEVEEMAQIMRQGVQQLEETDTVMAGVAAKLKDGGLVGDAGEEFQEAISGKLAPSIRRMQDKFTEIANDLMKAIEAMREGVDTAEGLFGG